MQRSSILGFSGGASLLLLALSASAQAPAPAEADAAPPGAPAQPATTSVELPPAELLRRHRESRAREHAARTSPELDRGAAVELDPRGGRNSGVALSAGLRNLVVLGSGYEPFAKRPLFWAFSLSGLVTAHEDGPLAVALGIGWDIGRSESTARGFDTGITAQRWTAISEARYALGPRLRAFGRLGIGAAHLHATLEDSVVGSKRGDGAFAFTADPGVGLALRLGSKKAKARPAFWLALDAGYLWTTGANLALTSEEAPERSAPLRLETLAFHGPYTRLNASLSF